MIRTRIAPSPTGEMHIGHIRTILYDYALAKNNGGEFVVRIEDTDRARYVEGAVERLLDVIKDYGLGWDEGPDIGGKYAPYVQSERLETYKQYAEDLIEKGHAYYCFLTPEETKELQDVFRKENKRFRSPHRNLTNDELKKKFKEDKPYVIRLKVPEDMSVTFEDVVSGTITYKSEEIDDQILIKQDGFPTYHLAVVVDDHLMKITHVLRGNDWIPSTPKHVLLYEAFGWEKPVYVHLPNLKEKGSGKKMSKRHGSVFASEFLAEGYLADAMLNFLMLLGWSSPEKRVHGEKEREIYSLEQFVKLFSIDQIHKTALVTFDRDKLVWFNREYLKMKSGDELQDILAQWVEKYALDVVYKDQMLSDPTLSEKITLVKERAKTLKEVSEMLKFFYVAPKKIDWGIKQLSAIGNQLSEIKGEVHDLIQGFSDDTSSWEHAEWEEKMRAIGDKFSAKHGDIFMVLRVAMTGEPVSPPLFEALQVLGKEEVLKRLR